MISLCRLLVSSFVPQLSEFNSDEYNNKAREIRFTAFRSLMREEFQLAYFGKISYESVENMSSLERRTMYQILVEQKKEEKKAQDEAINPPKRKKLLGVGEGSLFSLYFSKRLYIWVSYRIENN